jgi:hypothetical protein
MLNALVQSARYELIYLWRNILYGCIFRYSRSPRDEARTIFASRKRDAYPGRRASVGLHWRAKPSAAVAAVLHVLVGRRLRPSGPRANITGGYHPCPQPSQGACSVLWLFARCAGFACQCRHPRSSTHLSRSPHVLAGAIWLLRYLTTMAHQRAITHYVQSDVPSWNIPFLDLVRSGNGDLLTMTRLFVT